MRTMQFTEENIGEILRLLAGILHAGNIEFMTAGGAQVSSKSGQRVSPLFPHLPPLYTFFDLNLSFTVTFSMFQLPAAALVIV